MSARDWDAPILPKAASWIRNSGVFGVCRPLELRRRSKWALWDEWVALDCPLPPDLTPSGQFGFYRKLKFNLAGPMRNHPERMLKLAATHLGSKRASEANVNMLLGSHSREERDRIARLKGEEPPKPIRKNGPAPLSDLVETLPVEVRPAVAKAFRDALKTGRRIPELQIGRVMALEPELRPVGAMVLLDASWLKKAHTTVQKYVGVLEWVDDRLKARPGYALHRLLRELNRDPSLLSDRDQMNLRNYGVVLGAAKTFVRQRFSGLTAFRLLFPLSDPLSIQQVTRSARQVLAVQDELSEIERQDQVLFELEQSLRMDRIVNERQKMVGLIFNAYQATLAGLPDRINHPVSFDVRVPVTDDNGNSVDGAEQFIRFSIMEPAEVLRRVSEYDDPYAREHRLPLRSTAMAQEPLEKLGKLREELMCVYEGVFPVAPGGPVAEPFFVDIYRWAILEGTSQHLPFIADAREEVLAASGLSKTIQPPIDIFSHPTSLRHVARHARASNPLFGSVVIPIVALHHGMVLSALSHVIARSQCPRVAEMMQVQLGDEFIKGKVEGTKRYRLFMRPKNSESLACYYVPVEAILLLKEAAQLAARRWWPELQGPLIRLPERQLEHVALRDLPAGQYVFTTSARCLRAEEMQIIRHIGLWQLTASTLHAARHLLATKYKIAGVHPNVGTRLLQQVRGSKTFARYDHSAAVFHTLLAEEHAEREGRGL